MALDFYNLHDTKLRFRLFCLDDLDIATTESTFLEFRKATGLTLDHYGNTRLYQDHVNLIVKLLEDKGKKLLKNSQEGEHLAIIVNKFKQVKDGLLAIGD